MARLVALETEDKCRGVAPELELAGPQGADRRPAARGPGPGGGGGGAGGQAVQHACLLPGQAEAGAKDVGAVQPKGPRQHHWYYRSIACALESLADTPAWREYDWLIGQVFEEGDEGPSPGRPEETAKEEE